ncbi:MAG TPA: GntP family permease [Candidatus Copromorpha excrementigallinarum]|uniref:GntP family permease n=1 Tax=Candidatus Allocopromorpha excrementigallinarum TaxID=2840742 RepID=A0A9D1I2D4_9FIRM|nr:GntP family permease [Candidatus Copromorpha excrementigallinarum]
MDISIIVSGAGVIVALAAMAFLIFKRVSPILIGPLAALFVCLTSGISLFKGVTETYMSGVTGFFLSYFFIFLLGSIFGNIYQDSGAAAKIGFMISKKFGARNCMLACMISAAILSYGGINSFVIIFAVYPIALKLFEEADLPTYLLPGIVCGGMWTFAMTGPFTPQIPNIVSMEYLGTPSYAGLLPGLSGAAVMAVSIVIFMNYSAKKARLRGEHFQWPENVKRVEEESDAPGGLVSILPIAAVLIIFNVTSLDIIVCLLIGILLALVLFWKHLPRAGELLNMFNSAALSSVTVIINTAVIVGFGSVVNQTPFYHYATDVLMASDANPYIVAAVGANIFAGLLGSASGGIALMYETLGDTFMEYGAQGYNLEYIHRLCADGSGGLDSLPWNGSIVSVFAICNTTHKLSYKYNFVTCLVVPIAATFLVALPLCMIFG